MAWRKANREKINAEWKEWRKANKEKHDAAVKKWEANNPLSRRARKHARRAREMNAEGFHTPKDIRRIFDAQNGLCYWCGAELDASFHADHLVPLSRGGTNWPDNIACTCGPCNMSKLNKTPDEFRASLASLKT